MEQKYTAFISYRHAPLDQAVAKQLHSRIEQYTIPKGLRKNGKKLGRVFRDLEELPASSNLSDDIYRALDNSENLIVVCSREMAKSPWVTREVEYFLQHHSQDKVYTVLIDGEPAEVFPKALLTKTLPSGAVVDVEPLAVDVRADNQATTLKKLGREMNRLLAAMIGCPYDALVQRQQKRQRRRLLLGTGAVLAVALLFSGMMLVKNRQIDAKNEELEQTNQQLEEQKAQLQLNESELLTGKANQYLQTGELGLALPYALDALSNADGSSRPYYAPAEQALISSLSVFNSFGQDLLVDKTLSQTTPVSDFVICKEGSRLVTIDPYNVLRCFDTVSQTQLWQAQAASDARMFPFDDRLLIQTQHWLVALDVESGALLWETNCIYEGNTLSLEYSAVSSDRIIAIGSYMDADYTKEYFLLTTVDPLTGETLCQLPLTQGQSLLSADSYPYVQTQTISAISQDERYFAGCWKQVLSSQEARLHFYVLDLQEMTWQEIYSLPVESYSTQVHRMAFADNVLYILRSPVEEEAVAVLDAWNLDSKVLLWQTPLQPEEETYTLFTSDYHLTFTQKSCAVSCGKYLFWLTRGTGEVLVRGQMDSDIVLLEAREGGVFQIALMDGRLGYVWPNSSGTVSSSLPVTLYRTEQFRLHAGGFLQLAVENGRIGDMTVDGDGYTACVRQEDDRVITITKAVQAGAYFPRQEVEMALDTNLFMQHHIWQIGDGKLIMGPLDLDREEPPYQQFLLFDLTNPQEQTSLYAGSRYATADNLYFTADGKYCMECDTSGNISWYDTATGQQTVLSQRETVDLVTMGDTVYTASRYLSAGCVRQDGVTLAARLEEAGLTLWLDGVAQTVTKPEGAVLQKQNTAISRLLWVGENGYVIAGGFADADMSVDFLWIYDTFKGTWSRLDTQNALDNVQLCSTGKTLVLADTNGTAWRYDLETLSCLGSFNLLIPQDAIRNMKLVQEQQFLLVQTGDKQLIAYRLKDGQMVYQSKLDYINSPSVTEDGKGRLYISWGNGGLCLDGASWQELTEIPKLVHFDNTTGLLLSVDYAQSTFEEVLVIQRLPDTEELIRIGRELLNGK